MKRLVGCTNDVWLLAALFGACQADPGSGATAVPETAVTAGAETVRGLRATKDGSAWVRFRSEPDPIPVNEPFELEVEVFADASGDVPVEGAQLFVRGFMPAHGHGMAREPEAFEVAGAHGVYRVRGMLFHMVGAWLLSFDVVHNGLASSVDYELEL